MINIWNVIFLMNSNEELNKDNFVLGFDTSMHNQNLVDSIYVEITTVDCA